MCVQTYVINNLFYLLLLFNLRLSYTLFIFLLLILKQIFLTMRKLIFVVHIFKLFLLI